MLNKSTLNRRGELRQDHSKINQWFSDLTSKLLISHKGKFVCQNDKPCYFSVEQVRKWGYSTETLEKIYLGEESPVHYFVIQLPHLVKEVQSMQLLDLRTAALSAEMFDISSLFYSQGLINWHFSHQFCAKCGDKTTPSHAGHSRTCLNPICAREHFPRIEPAVIFSIEADFEGTNKLLLARQPSWPNKRYSVLAGFAEHGESLELAVEREALEEVGLVTTNVQYVASQPWPFPASLMVGFTCETKQHEISLIDQELEQAHWFSAEEIKQKVSTGELLMPFSVSISWNLVDRWYRKETGCSIKSIKLNEN